ncbi:MAG: restriction endonuclease subunit S [Candidatus Bathyarchaeota archaeon]|nr:restriction endonuclease subunit S [Candidatus Bathyarchaeota archaeon]
MHLTELNKIFTVKLGNKFDANKMDFAETGDINFISRDSKNNGCVGTVKKYNDIEPYNEGLITVSLGGSFLLSSFVQPKKFYTAQNVAVLTPLRPMNFGEKIFYCKCISMNRFKYSAFGREANKTLKFLQVPEKAPDWIEEYVEKTVTDLKKPSIEKAVSLEHVKFGSFVYSELFSVEKGKRLVVSKTPKKGNCPFVSATTKNNGISEMLDIEPIFQGNTITVSYDGSIGEAFYQPNPYWAVDSVNVLIPKFELNPFIAMFLITLIRKEKFRFNYGRKWHKERMEESVMTLPINEANKPNWAFIEEYIKSINYSRNLCGALSPDC